jgi:hypothetical protein
MFIKTFEDVRKFMINKTHINVFIDYSLSNLFGSIMVDPAFYVLEKGKSKERNAWFVSLDQYTRTPNEKYKKDFCLKALDDYVAGEKNEHNYSISQSKLKIIKSWPFIYWISDAFREKFESKALDDIIFIRQGGATGDNLRTLRFWWEVNQVSISTQIGDNLKWVFYQKGGPFRKWYGNNWCMLGYNTPEDYHYLKNHGNKLPSESFYFKAGVTYCSSGSKGISFRYMPVNHVISGAGPGIYPSEKYGNIFYYLAFLNSKICFYLADCLNPTVNTTQGDLKRIPFAYPSQKLEEKISVLSNDNVNILRELCKTSLLDFEFRGSSFTGIEEIMNYFNYENHHLSQVIINEAIINEKIFEVYELTEKDKAMVLAKEGKSIGGLPVLPEARDSYLSETEATKDFPLDNIREFIEALPTKEFTAEEREVIESGFPNLYQKNNDLEAFCTRHQVNPINVWYWFKQSNVIPQQRMHTLAMEFLADMIREILMEDEDGIIPLVPNAGEKVLLDRIEDKFREKGFSSAQYSSFDNVIGRPLNEYINKCFFAELSDHLNLFMYLPKTPFIWHLSSGPEQGFDCYLIIYKWSRDKLMRLRSVYIEHRERALINRQSDLSGNESADAQNEKDRIFRQLNEIEEFKKKIDELLEEGYDPILDDGVGKNIAPLQKKKMITYDVLNAGQLKKYLNADW